MAPSRLALARTWRTVRPLRPAQWVGRLRRITAGVVDGWFPGAVARAAARGAQATWREDWHPLWPELEPGFGHGEASAILDGRLTLHGRTVAAAPNGLPWDDAASLLWQFQLHAFDFAEPLLHGPSAEAVGWLRGAVDDWIRTNPPGRAPGWGPYCISRRLGRWMPLLTGYPAEGDARRIASAGAQAEVLLGRLEHDLQGNHLWENAVALALAGAAFEGPIAARWRRTGAGLLHRVFVEQLLPRGGHAERSAMYHAVLLEGLLGLLAAQQARGVVDAGLERAVRRMTRWLLDVTGPGGRLPAFNDTAPGVAASTASLARAAGVLGVREEVARDGALAADGWLVVREGGHHLVLDAAPMGLDEQPGHAHADTLALELTVAGAPVIVDPGTAGYAEDPFRAWSRSTAAHGTVAVDGVDSAELWATFRVGRRPGMVRCDGPQPLPAPLGRAWRLGGEHDGYSWLPGAPIAAREVVLWVISPEAVVLWIADRVRGSARSVASRIPLAPGVAWDAVSGTLTGGRLVPFGFDRVTSAEGRVSAGFGRWTPSVVAVGHAPGAAPTGWVLARGATLEVGERVVVHHAGRIAGSLPCPDRAPAVGGVAPG